MTECIDEMKKGRNGDTAVPEHSVKPEQGPEERAGNVRRNTLNKSSFFVIN